jgi:hypothetical protein
MYVEVGERAVLCCLLKTSPIFRRFYEEARMKKVGIIWWIWELNPWAPSNVGASANIYNYSIYYRMPPRTAMDAHMMAHEITHLIRYQNYDMLEVNCIQEEYSALSIYLRTLLEDFLVDSFLQNEYNFDLRYRYKFVIEFGKKNVKKEREDYFIKLLGGLDISNYMVLWDLITDQGTRNEWFEYLEWYETQRPDGYKIGIDIANIVRENGLDAIDKQRKIITKLMDKYKLHDKIFISN